MYMSLFSWESTELWVGILFLCFKMFLFSYSEVSTLKDLFGLASSGKHLLWSWYEGLVCLWVEMLNECLAFQPTWVLKYLFIFRA